MSGWSGFHDDISEPPSSIDPNKSSTLRATGLRAIAWFPPVRPGSARAPAIPIGFGGVAAAGCVRTDRILPACEGGRDAMLARSLMVRAEMLAKAPAELVSLGDALSAGEDERWAGFRATGGGPCLGACGDVARLFRETDDDGLLRGGGPLSKLSPKPPVDATLAVDLLGGGGGGGPMSFLRFLSTSFDRLLGPEKGGVEDEREDAGYGLRFVPGPDVENMVDMLMCSYGELDSVETDMRDGDRGTDTQSGSSPGVKGFDDRLGFRAIGMPSRSFGGTISALACLSLSSHHFWRSELGGGSPGSIES
jgi:hypothetical protein